MFKRNEVNPLFEHKEPIMIDVPNLDKEIQQRWDENRFLEHNAVPFSQESSYLRFVAKSKPWVPYEQYMQAKLVAAEPGQIGLLHIEFPAETAEDNRIHTHLYSDRLVTVMDGSGFFIVAPLGKPIESIPVGVGDRVWLPRNVRHTWYSGKNGLLVESIHNPFFAFDDSNTLVYDMSRGYLEFSSDGSFIEKPVCPEFSVDKVRPVAPQHQLVT
jgi:quercetin dioxygenase-like cupin family protein